MCVDKFTDGDVDHGSVEDQRLRVFIDIEALLRLRHVTHSTQELPVAGENGVIRQEMCVLSSSSDINLLPEAVVSV